jgi:DNA-binding Lrp family transcriptional regulator
MRLTDAESKILNRIQRDFPLTADPFSEISDELSMREDDFIRTAQKLKNDGIVRNISGIFNAGRLGYVSCLVAFRVDDGNCDRAAAVINEHPGVSHNYKRRHSYNIWFTLAEDSREKLERAVRVLADRAGVSDYLVLWTEKLLKIGLLLAVGEDPGQENSNEQADEPTRIISESHLSDSQKESIRLLQMDLPIEKNPFASIIASSRSFLDLDSFLYDSRRFRRDGILRRYSAVLRHREAGYRSNAMTVWKPDSGADMKKIEDIFHKNRMISHLYIRTVYPGRWEYPLFAMMHARTDEELSGIIRNLALESGIREYEVLTTMKEFKKERVLYFSSKFREWEHQAGV